VTESQVAGSSSVDTPAPASVPTTTIADIPSPLAVTIRVIDQNSQEVFFKLKRTSPMEKVMKLFCERVGHPPTYVRFMFDGVRIDPTSTPDSLHMEDNDIVDVMIQQTGGDQN